MLGMTSEGFIKAGKSGLAFLIAEDQKLNLPGKVFTGSFDSSWSVDGTIGSLKNLKVLKSAGLEAKEVAGVLKNVYGKGAKSTGKILKKILRLGKKYR